MAEGYLIEHGRVTAPLRGATLVGNGIDILRSIDMIGSDFEVKSGICGKDGQSVPVGTGQATLRIAPDDRGRHRLMIESSTGCSSWPWRAAPRPPRSTPSRA